MGAPFALLARPRLGVAACCVQAYPLGLLLAVLVSALLVFSPLPYDGRSLLLGVAAVAGGGALLQVRAWRRAGRPSGRELATGAGASALFAGAAWGATRWDLSVWTFDSHVLVAVGRSIAHHGALAPEIGPELASRGIFQVLLQATSIFVDARYLRAVPTVLALVFVAAFALLGVRALGGAGRPRASTLALVALTVAAVASSYFPIVQAFYVHETLPAAVFLFLAATAFWLAETEESSAWLPFAHAHLLAFALTRMEAPGVALIFLAIAHAGSGRPRRVLDAWLGAWALATLGWLAVLRGAYGDGRHDLRTVPQVLDAGRIAWMMAGVAATALGLVALRRPRLARLRPRVPRLLALASAGTAVAAFAWKPSHLLESTSALLANAQSLSWGGLWCVFALLLPLSRLLPRVPHAPLFTTGSLVTLAAVLLLSALALPYEVRWSDSGNRMLTLALPLLAFHLLLAYGGALQAGAPRRVSTPATSRR